MISGRESAGEVKSNSILNSFPHSSQNDILEEECNWK